MTSPWQPHDSQGRLGPGDQQPGYAEHGGGYPGQGQGQPGYQGQGQGQPGYQGQGQPGYPGGPGYGGQPGYPGQPGYQGGYPGPGGPGGPGYGAPPGYGPPAPFDASAPFGRHPLTGEAYSEKQKLTAGLLQILLGSFGAGRWYLGDTGIALAQLFTCGGLGVWALIDGIMMLTGNVRDKHGRPLRD
ncbi:TM2 domain-containing protein [Frankia sp. AiPs1]|uniref:TM2 domain-containing protein n=1 Tax=Frankia sp. AiPa1 TaxID=573492 RepID=UPI00202B5469|nr:TM2 domain-containing protein [Frankia sp. AiPa1]MCL9762065.1 TM2 domain-containing protein [Frankia sp. AiPa1]